MFHSRRPARMIGGGLTWPRRTSSERRGSVTPRRLATWPVVRNGGERRSTCCCTPSKAYAASTKTYFPSTRRVCAPRHCNEMVAGPMQAGTCCSFGADAPLQRWVEASDSSACRPLRSSYCVTGATQARGAGGNTASNCWPPGCILLGACLRQGEPSRCALGRGEYRISPGW